MEKEISILIVEDEAIIAMTLQESLRQAGYTVGKIVPTGEEAVEYVQHTQPDIILFDNRLRGNINGIDAACIIHESYDIPVVFITGYQYEEFVEDAERARPVACISKPFNFIQLKKIIDSHFGNSIA